MSRRQAYLSVFNDQDAAGRIVLADLAKFCRAHQSTFHAEQSISDRLDGRREVWLRITSHIHMTDDQLVQHYLRKDIPNE